MTEIIDISRQTWEMKYHRTGADGAQPEETIEASWRRVAAGSRSLWLIRNTGLLNFFRRACRFQVTAGWAYFGRRRYLARRDLIQLFRDGRHFGRHERHLQKPEGSRFHEAERRRHRIDFWTLRPEGAAVKGVGADASGPLSFMDVWDPICRTIMSAGARRGAMVVTMRCDHPDIEAFIDAKRDPEKLRMFKLSVLVTDAFMAAVKTDGD